MKSSGAFDGLIWTEQYQTRKKVLLINFRKLSNKSFEMNFDEPLNKRKSNWNAFYTPYISHSLRIQKIFAVWYEDRAFQILKFSMSQEVKKRAFCSFDYGELKKFSLLFFSSVPGYCSDSNLLQPLRKGFLISKFFNFMVTKKFSRTESTENQSSLQQLRRYT